MSDDVLRFVDEDGNTQELFFIEEARLNGTVYILVTDSCEEESDAYILKDISEPDAEEAEFVFVEEENELAAVAALFREMLEDIEFV